MLLEIHYIPRTTTYKSLIDRHPLVKKIFRPIGIPSNTPSRVTASRRAQRGQRAPRCSARCRGLRALTALAHAA